MASTEFNIPRSTPQQPTDLEPVNTPEVNQPLNIGDYIEGQKPHHGGDFSYGEGVIIGENKQDRTYGLSKPRPDQGYDYSEVLQNGAHSKDIPAEIADKVKTMQDYYHGEKSEQRPTPPTESTS